MNSEWKSFKLSEICTKIGSGATPSGGKSSYSEKEEIALIRSQNVLDFVFSFDGLAYINPSQAQKLNNVEIEEEDVLINITGDSVARVCMVPTEVLPARVNQHVAILRANKSIFYPKLLKYLLLTNENKAQLLVLSSSGATRNALTKTMLENFEVFAPDDLEEQKKLADFLQSFDEKIANNNRINQTLEAIAQALFKSWFVDFEPVKAKIQAREEGSDPQRAAMCAISGKTEEELQQLPREKYKELAATADLFPDELVESESEDYAEGLIPKGWMLKPFGELLERTVGGDWGAEVPDERHTVEVKIIRGTDITTLQSGGIEKVPTRFVEEKKLKSRQLQDCDIVIEISGGSPTQPTGRSIMITKNILERLNLPAEPASFCRLFRPNNKILSYFLAQHLVYIYNNGKTWFYQNQSTGISNFQTSMFLENEIIAIPPKEILKHFSQKIEPLINRISSNENIKLAELRDSLLPKLLSGEILQSI